MIASLTGRVTALTNDAVVIDVGGVGLAAQITPSISIEMSLGSSLTLHTSLVVREDSLTLFGFVTSEERDLFELLQTASGVGPRLAQAMLSVHTPQRLRQAIVDEDLRALESVPGIGRKGAQRIVIELKDKVNGVRLVASSGQPTGPSPWRDDVHAALVGLGFSAREATEAIDQAVSSSPLLLEGDRADVAAILRAALRSRDRG